MGMERTRMEKDCSDECPPQQSLVESSTKTPAFSNFLYLLDNGVFNADEGNSILDFATSPDIHSSYTCTMGG